LTDQADLKWLTGSGLYPFLWAFGSKFDPMGFDFDKDEDILNTKLAPAVNANNPNLIAFQQNGGKLIMYTGTADPLVPFPDTVNYYERVVAFEGQHLPDGVHDPLEATKEFFRYYLVPGMGHCAGGPGLQSFGQAISVNNDDLLYALELWAEQNRAPGEIPAVGTSAGTNQSGKKIERNVCPYPELPTYTGGDAAEPASFRCQVHPHGNVAVPASRYLQ